MQIFSLVILVLILVALGYLIIFLRKVDLGNENDQLLKVSESLSKLSDNIVKLSSIGDTLPELTSLKIKEQLHTNNEGLLIKFSELRESLLLGLSVSESKLNKDINKFKDDLIKGQGEAFFKLSSTVEEKLEKIAIKVRENLDEGFKKTNETFSNVLMRLTKIDEAQKKIESLSTDVVSLQDVLTDKKTRGIFGEVQLTHVLSSVFGENNNKIYSLQYLLTNGKIVDSILFLPEPLGHICVDSKFPLENYKRMFDREETDEVRQIAQKEFGKNIKKHIDDISSKYIIPNETSDQAIMFLPAEAIFAELHAHYQEVVEYANKKRVWITSPTTFLATLTTVQSVLTNIERNKYMNILHQEINKLGEEFSRYQIRWNDLSKHIATVNKDIDKINVTSNKIAGRFQKILEVEVEGRETPGLTDN